MARRSMTHAAGLAALSLIASHVGAQAITPTSYTLNPNGGMCGTPTQFPCYQDVTGTQLTDGLFGAANLSPVTGWVGWNVGTPTLTFNFGAPVTIGKVRIDFDRFEAGAGILLPQTVMIGGTTFAVAQNAIPTDITRGPLDFNGLWSGSSLTIALTPYPDAAPSFPGQELFVFVDEVQLFAPTATTTPEPASAVLLATGLFTIGGVAARRKRATG